MAVSFAIELGSRQPDILSLGCELDFQLGRDLNFEGWTQGLVLDSTTFSRGLQVLVSLKKCTFEIAHSSDRGN